MNNSGSTEDVRKLTTIRKISDIVPIEGADKIEVAIVDGWKIVVGRNSFKTGDEAIYMELDSALPLDDPRFEFLRNRGVKTIDDKEYHVLRSAKLRGVISQGILFDLKDFPEIANNASSNVTDFSKTLGIIKYEPPIPANSGTIIGGWDSRIQKTDSERAQNLVEFLKTVNPEDWEATVKVDGTSATIKKDQEGFKTFSRNYRVDNIDSRYEIAEKYGILEELNDGEIVQFELAGPGINGNKQKLKEVRPFVFSVFNKDGSPKPRAEWGSKLEEWAVPIVDTSHLDSFNINNLMELADNCRGNLTKDIKDEGIVFHHKEGKQFQELGNRNTFKIVSDKYLLKNG